jgi:hypothetical protein
MRSYSARAAPGRRRGARNHEASHRAHHQLTSWQWPRDPEKNPLTISEDLPMHLALEFTLGRALPRAAPFASGTGTPPAVPPAIW